MSCCAWAGRAGTAPPPGRVEGRDGGISGPPPCAKAAPATSQAQSSAGTTPRSLFTTY